MTTIDEIKKMLDDISLTEKIGIAISTHNRYDVFKKTYEEIQKFLPIGTTLVVVDDASVKPVPEATFRFNENVGIARAKNKCLELLYNAGCEHFFLFDDDCYPKVEDWYKPYIESREPHLNYIFLNFKTANKSLNDTIEIYRDSSIVAYSHVRGCMCYYKRICLDKVGGMSPIFGRWGFEHPDLSNRIYNAGLTSFRYMDVVDSDKLIYSIDENNGNVGSSVLEQIKSECISVNSKIYDARLHENEYIEFREKKNIILSCIFANMDDPQRVGQPRIKPDKALLSPLIDSVNRQSLVILTDCFDNALDENVEYIRVETSLRNVYFQRWVSYYQYLLSTKYLLDKVFIVDGTDVQMQNNPFPYMSPTRLYLGDEVEKTSCKWMIDNHRNSLIQDFIAGNGSEVLLNAGLLGGSVDIILSFIKKFLSVYFYSSSDSRFNTVKPDYGNTDMGLFNYVARTEFNDIIVHGTQVNTVFKDNKPNSVSWFKHK